MSKCTITLDLPKFGKIAQDLRENLPGVIASTLQFQRAMLFDNGGVGNGHPAWAPLKHRKGQILKDTGTLSQSIGPRGNGVVPGRGAHSIVRLSMSEVTIGTDLFYAIIHDQGADIESHEVMIWRNKKSGRFQKFSKKRGNLEVHMTGRYSIPKRNFSDITIADEQELAQTVGNYITDVWGKHAGN